MIKRNKNTTEFPIQLQLPFLGQRRYIQGPSLFDALWPYVPHQSTLSFKIPHSITTDRLEAISFKRSNTTTDSFAATLSWATEDDAGVLGVKPLSPSTSPQRIPYDESQVTELAVFSDSFVELNKPSPFSFAATISSLNKAMLTRQLPQEEPGRWLFIRLDLTPLPERTTSLSLRLQNALAGGHIVQTEISVDGSAVDFMIDDPLDFSHLFSLRALHAQREVSALQDEGLMRWIVRTAVTLMTNAAAQILKDSK